MLYRIIFTIASHLVPQFFSTHTAIESLAKNFRSSDFFFIQIGANDGKMNDPIHHYVKTYKWKGILVEPIQSYFDDLKKTYKGQKGLIFERSAISDKKKKETIYKVQEDLKFVPTWYKGIASFDKSVIEKHTWKHGFPNVADHIVEEEIQCITLQNLITKHKVKHVDLLIIDVEGHETPIIQQLPKLKLRPQLVIFEYIHLSKKNLAACKKILSDLDYTFSEYGKDIIAFQES